jgi:hypothetical protein
VARLARAYSQPPTVWQLDGADLGPARPEPLPPEPPLPPEVAGLAGLIASAGAQPVGEHGLLLAEVRGLEVGRVQPGPAGPELLVGVGRHDRQARALISAEAPTLEEGAAELARVVTDIRARRVSGGASHPATLLSPERWLRAAVLARPELAGARRLAPASPALVRPNLKVRSPAPAVGVDGDGARVAVVCSTGIDPELVPAAADALEAAAAAGGGPADGPEQAGAGGTDDRAVSGVRLVLALPAGDDIPLVRRAAEQLAAPAEVRAVAGDWRSLAP